MKKYLITEEKFDEALKIVALGTLGLFSAEDLKEKLSTFPESVQDKLAASILAAQVVKSEQEAVERKLKKFVEKLKNPQPTEDGKSIESKLEQLLREALKDDEGTSPGTRISVR